MNPRSFTRHSSSLFILANWKRTSTSHFWVYFAQPSFQIGPSTRTKSNSVPLEISSSSFKRTFNAVATITPATIVTFQAARRTCYSRCQASPSTSWSVVRQSWTQNKTSQLIKSACVFMFDSNFAVLAPSRPLHANLPAAISWKLQYAQKF